MKENEKNLNNLVDKLNFELKSIKASNEYKIGKRIYGIKLFQKIIDFLENKQKSKIPEDELSYSYKDENYDYTGLSGKKIAVYKCITGNYDKIIAPEYKSERVDYILFTNNKNVKSDDWKIVYIDNVDGLNDAMLNRYVRMHPGRFLNGYDYAVYVDGNMIIYSDLSCLVNRINKKYGVAFSMHSTRKKITSEYAACRALKKGNDEKMHAQIDRYLSEGMPNDYGLLETTVIAIDLKNKRAIDILDRWWDEFLSAGSMRDQVALPYVLWKNNIKVTEIGTLGNNIWLNPKFTKVKHLK